MRTTVENVKKFNWGNSLTRTGLFQPKVIAAEAIRLPVELARGITIRMDGYIWVNDFVAYSQDSINEFPKNFEKAFEVEPEWPIRIVNELEKLAERQKNLLRKMQVTQDNLGADGVFSEYRELLRDIMKYYVFAVPLTDYCERELKGLNFDYTDFAVAYKSLDIDSYSGDLQTIAESSGASQSLLKKENLKKFAWIKTAYNIIDPYTEKDLMEAMKNLQPERERADVPAGAPPVLVGLQCGIYLRNRMKELCQQLWYYFDPVALMFAEKLSIGRIEFYTLTPDEALNSIKAKKAVVAKEELALRRQGFVAGFVRDDFFILTGDAVRELTSHFKSDVAKDIGEFKGSVACRGSVKGVVKIIRGRDEFTKFNQGEILVTSMTTPDFILLMKKSGAIVTDEGGLSCHAAIMSRELKIPCIIGTKIATKVLKDGDMVEVDANNGIIKRLS